MQRYLRCAIIFGIALLLPVSMGCGSSATTCAAVVIPGVVVSVYDARTGQPAADGATATLTLDNQTETMQPYGYTNVTPGKTGTLVSFSGGGGPAVYTVDVTKPGYAPWKKTGVRVTEGPCDPNTVFLRADLQPTQ